MQDFRGQLLKQLGFLLNSCIAYDKGDKDEAVRLATTLRVMFHSTRSSTSLIRHLKLEDNLKMHSSMLKPTSPGAKQVMGINLVGIKFEGLDAEAFPRLKLDRFASDRSAKLVSFDKWWGEEAIFKNFDKEITRKQLILNAANKDGGAHVDTDLEPDYEEFVNGVIQGIVVNAGGKDIPIRNAHLATIRQIAFEVLLNEQLRYAAQQIFHRTPKK